MTCIKAKRFCALATGALVFAAAPAAAQTPRAAAATAQAAPAQAAVAAIAPAGAAQAPTTTMLDDLESSADFVGDAFPDVHFLNQASRMAIAHATDEKVRDFALRVARDETTTGLSLMQWVHAPRHREAGQSADAALAAPFETPRMQPSQLNILQRLSSLQGRDFDVFYVSAEKECLQHLEAIYEDFVQNGADPGLHAMAAKELSEVKQLILAAGGL